MPLSFPSMHWGGSELVPPVSDYVLWLDFGDISTIFMANGKNPDGTTPAGAYVGQIKDKSPKLRHAFNYPSGGTAGFQYVQPALGYNGRSVLYASGTGILTSTWEHYDNLTIFMIYKHMTSPDRSRIFSQVAYSAGDVTYDPMIYSSTVALLSASTTGGLTAGVTISSGWWWRLMHTKLLDNATNKVGAAVSPVGAIAVGDLKKTAKVDYAIGGRIGTDAITLSMMGKGQYAEVIAYPRELTLPEIKAMDDYFAAKYGDTTISLGAAPTRAMTTAEIAAVQPQPEWVLEIETTTPMEIVAPVLMDGDNFTTDWGDGTTTTVGATHTYATPGKYTVKITHPAGKTLNPSPGRFFFKSLRRQLKGLTSFPFIINTDVSLNAAFAGTDITAIPSGMFANVQIVWDGIGGEFARCDKLTSIAPDLFTGRNTVKTFAYLFKDCTSLRHVPANLFQGKEGVNMTGIFNGCTLDSTDYGNLLIALEAGCPAGVTNTFDGGNSKYPPAAATARTSLIGRGWHITDGGPV